MLFTIILINFSQNCLKKFEIACAYVLIVKFCLDKNCTLFKKFTHFGKVGTHRVKGKVGKHYTSGKISHNFAKYSKLYTLVVVLVIKQNII